MRHPDDLDDAMVCTGCEQVIEQKEIDRDEYVKTDDPVTFDDLFFHPGCVPVALERAESNERWWPR